MRLPIYSLIYCSVSGQTEDLFTILTSLELVSPPLTIDKGSLAQSSVGTLKTDARGTISCYGVYVVAVDFWTDVEPRQTAGHPGASSFDNRIEPILRVNEV